MFFIFSVVASISAGNEELTGIMIVDAIDTVGRDGILSVESSSSLLTMVEVEKGIEVCVFFVSF